MAESRAVREKNGMMKREIEKLRGKVNKGSQEDSEVEEEENGPEIDRSRQALSEDQRVMLEALERVGRRDIKIEIPMFCVNINPQECMDWIEEFDITLNVIMSLNHKG